MSISFDHMIIPAKDREVSARFFIELAEARSIEAREPFANVELDDGVMLQFAESPLEFPPQHYAFRVDDEHFDRIMVRIKERGLEHWADPLMTLPGQTNIEHGGRGVYILDPAGHFVEFMTRSYR
ncbi:VOC family protein [Paeniglutamicibacter sp. NPDC012692]|uniref:VOC family protein n=1 Tax=Paeniglutamicibacter sp. NPDC012692 TaxID=3364388 RepID=UPI0036C651C0